MKNRKRLKKGRERKSASNAGTWRDGLATERVAVAMVEGRWEEQNGGKQKQKLEAVEERWEIEKGESVYNKYVFGWMALNEWGRLNRGWDNG